MNSKNSWGPVEIDMKKDRGRKDSSLMDLYSSDRAGGGKVILESNVKYRTCRKIILLSGLET